MLYVFLFLITFFIGSIPFSYLLGKIFFKVDIRDFGKDRNPGPTNSFRAVGFKLGFPSLLFEYLKGVLPLSFIFSKYNLPFIPSVLIAIAPVLGHMFTPFLRFKGGKGVTTTFGIWSALTLWEVPTFLGGIFTLFVFLRKFYKEKITDKMIVVISTILLVVFVSIKYSDLRLTSVAVINSILLLFGQYRDNF
ncbi:MAG: glycerol-3-phosphate acyltransferase [Caldisericaceae bacterium]